jgi:hypothetical protein
MSRRDWILLVIAAGEGPLQPVHLQKALFLLSRNLDPSKLLCRRFYRFEPYDYGPFCAQIYPDVDSLVQEGMVRIEQPQGVSYQTYSATSDGLTRAAQLRESLAPEVSRYLLELVRWTVSKSFSELVSAIYHRYPEMKAKSVFRES